MRDLYYKRADLLRLTLRDVILLCGNGKKEPPTEADLAEHRKYISQNSHADRLKERMIRDDYEGYLQWL